MVDGRGISESELVEEIDAAWEDIYATADKASLYSLKEGGCTENTSPQFLRACSEHVCAIGYVEKLLRIGNKYFPGLDLEEYLPVRSYVDMNSQLEAAIRDLREGRKFSIDVTMKDVSED